MEIMGNCVLMGSVATLFDSLTKINVFSIHLSNHLPFTITDSTFVLIVHKRCVSICKIRF